MEDKVGEVIPSEKEIAKLVEEIEAVEKKIEKYTVALSSEQRTGTTKMRIGGENVVGQVGTLANNHGLKLPKISVEGMNADLTLAQRIRPLAAAAARLSQRLDDTVLEAQSECWWAATAFYTALARIASADPVLEKAMEPLIKFFAVGRRQPKEPKP
jgi:hypothetical protein